MTTYLTKLWIKSEQALRAEEGEVASWLIVAAGLAAAAVAAVATLDGVIQDLVSKVADSAGV